MAVHAVYRKAVWIEAELVVRRTPRRRRLDPRRARVSLQASPGFRRRPTARGRRLQLGGRQRQAVDVPKPRAGETDGHLVVEAPSGNAGSCIPAARIRGHRRGTWQTWRDPRTDSRPCAVRIRPTRRPNRPRRRSGPGRHHTHRDLPAQFGLQAGSYRPERSTPAAASPPRRRDISNEPRESASREANALDQSRDCAWRHARSHRQAISDHRCGAEETQPDSPRIASSPAAP